MFFNPYQKFSKYRINITIWALSVNDIFTWGMFFIYTILIGLYLAEKLDRNAVEMVSVGAGFAYFARALTQVPIGIIGDRIKNELDEVIFLIIGNFLMGVPVILTTQITSYWQYFVLQIVFGIGSSMNIVDWRKLFAKSLDKGKEGLEYAVYDTSMSLAIAVLSICSGVIAGIGMKYFEYVIGGAGVMMICSNVFLIPLYFYRKRTGGIKRMLKEII